MKNKYILSTLLAGVLVLGACEDDNVQVSGGQVYPELSSKVRLKSVAKELGIKLGVGFSYEDINSSDVSRQIVREFDNVTFGYAMKHGAIVQNDGTYNWTNADVMVDWATYSNLAVYGHTLAWHSNQNGSYLRDNVKWTGAPTPVNLISNSNFDVAVSGGNGYDLGSWNSWGNSSSRNRSAEGAGRGDEGYAMVLTNPSSASNYSAQATIAFPAKLIEGHNIHCEAWVKSSVSNGSIQMEIQPNGGGQYSGNKAVGTEWTKITWDLVADNDDASFFFDFGLIAGTYYIDDVLVYDVDAPPAGPPALISNGNFDTAVAGGSGYDLGPWNSWGNSSSRGRSAEGEGRGDKGYAMVLTNPTSASNYNAQATIAFPAKLIEGHNYKAEAWVKSSVSNGSIQMEIQPNGGGQYSGDKAVGTEWTRITWDFVADNDDASFFFDFGLVAGTYYIDDVSVKDMDDPASLDAPTEKDIEFARTALTDWITTSVSHFKANVHVWDVVNESIGDDGLLRNMSNTEAASDVFVWSAYLGADYAAIAFETAHAADPDAILFINDYNLESNPAKLDALIAYVKETQTKLNANGKGAKIDGIGTQMHISSVLGYEGIRPMFEKLAATGLKIKISELDVRVNSSKKANYVLTLSDAEFQAAMYKFIIKTYLEVIPKEQQYGITIWGINDGSSWLNDSNKKLYYCPLLWNDDFKRKPAYNAVYQALTGQ